MVLSNNTAVCSNVTTDNQPYPAAWGYLMFLITFFFMMTSFIDVRRTWFNIWNNNEHRYALSSRYVWAGDNIHAYRFFYMGTPIISFMWMIGAFSWAWSGYVNSLGSAGFALSSNIRPSTTAVLILTTSSMRLGLLVVYIGCILSMYNKLWNIHRDITHPLHGLLSKLKFPITGGRAPAHDAEEQIPSGTKAVEGEYNGINLILDGKERALIFYFNDIIWGNLPLVGGSLALSWDRNGYYTNSWVQWFTFWTAVFLSLFWHMWTWVKVGGFTTFMNMDHETVAKALGILYREKNEDLRECAKLGMASSMFGVNTPIKGHIPTQNVPALYVFARVMYSFAEGFANYNDDGQAVVYFCKYLIPGILALYAGDFKYYIAYETLFVFWFDTLTYIIQGTLFTSCLQQDVNMNYMTLQQSARYANDGPLVVSGTSFYFVVYFAFAVTLLSVGFDSMRANLRVSKFKRLMNEEEEVNEALIHE